MHFQEAGWKEEESFLFCTWIQRNQCRGCGEVGADLLVVGGDTEVVEAGLG